MKRYWIITVTVALVAAAATVACHYSPRLFGNAEPSAIYNHCVGQPGIEATFIKQLKVNDSCSVDATVVVANDSTAWEWMRHEFSIPTDSVLASITGLSESATISYLSQTMQHDGTEAEEDIDLIVITPSERTLTAYHNVLNEQLYHIFIANMLKKGDGFLSLTLKNIKL